MRQFDSFRAITRRALSIDYKSPLICELPAESSGSGFGIPATLDIEPVARRAGPASLVVSGNVLNWSDQSYIFSYVVYYSTSAQGPFSILASGVQAFHFDVTGLLAPGTYYFKVTGLEPDAGETLPSPIAGPATIT